MQLATDGSPAIADERLVDVAAHDPSPAVRLALASAMPAMPEALCWKVGEALAGHAEDAADRFLPKMIWFGLGRVAEKDFMRALKLADSAALPSLSDSIRWFAASKPAGRELLVARMSKDSDEVANRELKILGFALKSEAKAAMPSGWPSVQSRLAASNAVLVNELSALFGDEKVVAAMRGTLADSKASVPARRMAFDLLKRIGDAKAAPLFAGLLDVEEFRSAVIPLLSRSTDPATATALIQRYKSFSDLDKSAALNTLTSRAALALPLLKAVAGGTFERKSLTSFHVRQMRSLNDAELNKVLDATWGKVNESSAETKATITRLLKAYKEAPLWAFDGGAGKQVFQQVCAVCHTLNGTGGKIGPDLTGSWRNGPEYFVENIVDPNAVVGEQYQLNVITKNDGTILSGIIEQESDGSVTVRTITEAVIVSKADIKSRQKLAQSLMPPGMLEALPERKVIELLKFLTSKS